MPTGNQRSDWQPDNVNEPADADKDWDVDQKPPASWFNWFFESVVLDLGDLINAIFVDSGADTGRLKNPVEIATGGLSRVYRESGVGDFAIAYNAEFDAANDEWLEIDSNAATPSLIVRNPSLSGITGLSASDLEHETQYLKLEAASIASGVITWQLAGSEVGLFTSQAVHLLQFEDRSGDGSQWTMREDPGTGELEVDHPDFASPILIRQDGRISNVADGTQAGDVATIGQTGAGLTKVGERDVSGVSAVEFGANSASGIALTGARLYYLRIDGEQFAGDADPYIQFSSDGGASYITADYAYEMERDVLNGATNEEVNGGTASRIDITDIDVSGNVPFEFGFYLVKFHDATHRPRLRSDMGHFLSINENLPKFSMHYRGIGILDQLVAADGFRFSFDGGGAGFTGLVRLYEVV